MLTKWSMEASFVGGCCVVGLVGVPLGVTANLWDDDDSEPHQLTLQRSQKVGLTKVTSRVVLSHDTSTT